MSAVPPVRAAASAGGAARATAQRSLPLLPPPPIASPADFQDATIILFASQIGQSANDRRAAEAQMQRVKTASDDNMNKELGAAAKQREAERAARGFWGFLKKLAGAIAKIAAVVVSTVSAVFTGGSTLALAAAIATIALSGGAKIVRETRLFGALSDKIAMGMDIGAAATGGLGAFASGASAATSAADATTATMRKVGAVAQGVGAGASATASAAGAVVAGFQHDADLALADAEDARGKTKMLAQERQLLIEWFGQIAQVERDAFESTTKSLEGMQQATQIAITGVRA